MHRRSWCQRIRLAGGRSPLRAQARKPSDSARAAARDRPRTASVISEAEAMQIAQPLASKAASEMVPAGSKARNTSTRSPHIGLSPRACAAPSMRRRLRGVLACSRTISW